MIKIIIDGEGSREKFIGDNFKNADYEIMARCTAEYGYNKTWVTILKDDKELLNSRLDLTIKEKFKSLKELLINDIKNDIEYCNNAIKKNSDVEKFKSYIKECEKVKLILEAMDNKGEIKSIYNYSFYFKGNKVWEYNLEETQEEKYTETTINILCGNVEGYGRPIAGAKKEDIICIIKEIQVSF